MEFEFEKIGEMWYAKFNKNGTEFVTCHTSRKKAETRFLTEANKLLVGKDRFKLILETSELEVKE